MTVADTDKDIQNMNSFFKQHLSVCFAPGREVCAIPVKCVAGSIRSVIKTKMGTILSFHIHDTLRLTMNNDKGTK